MDTAETTPFKMPETSALEQGLSAVLSHSNFGGKVSVLLREANIDNSSFATEIITCLIDEKHEKKLFCKYGPVCAGSSFGHRGGVSYEGEVYERFLQTLPCSLPSFHGTHVDASAGHLWLILGYINDCTFLGKSTDPEAMNHAARWLGMFHTAGESFVAGRSAGFMLKYDADYYMGWAYRTNIYAGELHKRFAWLATLCRRFEEVVPMLLEANPTVIHGEFTSRNVLFNNGMIYPVDWESAAIAAGEIDLATMTDGWPEDDFRRCALTYRQARWPHGAPSDLKRRLEAARIYIQLRWLGDRPEWTVHEGSLWRFRKLWTSSKKLGLI